MSNYKYDGIAPSNEEEYEKDIEKIEKLEKIPMPQISLFDYYKNKKKEKENE